MNDMFEKLREYGGDMDGVMGRFLGDTELYQVCFTSFLEDKTFPQLGEAILEEDYAMALELAHTLKGITGNMGLTPLYQVVCDMVQAMRGEEYSGLQDYYLEITKQMEELRALKATF